jgi:hypothetical protein
VGGFVGQAFEGFGFGFWFLRVLGRFVGPFSFLFLVRCFCLYTSSVHRGASRV